ncbi:hypothetical protein ACN4EE_12375 [Geminocystis sp. CENA526]|uniref:hypothetical protein n=1 Tax=Geminocystis sp. CENA526 TaxID=1355871 RepID=UPI003D6EBED9
MTTKQILLQEIESMSEEELNEILILVEKMKQESNANKSNSTQFDRQGSGKSISRHAGKWVGDDFQECLQMVYDSRGVAKF